jgi:hypothetical protein
LIASEFRACAQGTKNPDALLQFLSRERAAPLAKRGLAKSGICLRILFAAGDVGFRGTARSPSTDAEIGNVGYVGVVNIVFTSVQK